MKTTKVKKISKTSKVAAPKAAPAKVMAEKAKAAPSCGCGCESGYCDGHFGKIFFGLLLLLLGLFYLARNLGILPQIDVNFKALWPLLIIAAGFFMVNRKSRASIIIGIFAALVFMLVVAFFVNFQQTKNEFAVDTSMPALRHVVRPKVNSLVPFSSEDVKLNIIAADQVIASPLLVEGSARGAWFFEGSFPVKILDANGQELGSGIAQSQSDWMTENFVPFKASINFTRPTSSAGSLVLEKDNPSGLPENAKQVVVPIKF